MRVAQLHGQRRPAHGHTSRLPFQHSDPGRRVGCSRCAVANHHLMPRQFSVQQSIQRAIRVGQHQFPIGHPADPGHATLEHIAAQQGRLSDARLKRDMRRCIGRTGHKRRAGQIAGCGELCRIARNARIIEEAQFSDVDSHIRPPPPDVPPTRCRPAVLPPQ